MNIQEIAQNLVNEIQAEVKESTEKAMLGRGAIQGVNELYSRLHQAQQNELINEQNNKSKPKKKARKSKS